MQKWKARKKAMMPRAILTLVPVDLFEEKHLRYTPAKELTEASNEMKNSLVMSEKSNHRAVCTFIHANTRVTLPAT